MAIIRPQHPKQLSILAIRFQKKLRPEHPEREFDQRMISYLNGRPKHPKVVHEGAHVSRSESNQSDFTTKLKSVYKNMAVNI